MTTPQWTFPEELKAMNAFEPDNDDHLPDKIGPEPSSDALEGCSFEYSYPSGMGYRLSFSEGRVFSSLPEKIQGVYYLSLPCRVRELRPNQYLAHWLTPGRHGSISVVIDIDAKRIDCSSLMPGKFLIWDRATFTYKTKGEGALYNKPPTVLPDPW